MSEMRPVTILIAALGGEGGGVLADWIVAAATIGGYPVQSTSIPGVAQRTGATTYYLEMLPRPLKELQGAQPMFALTPTAGDLDLVVASELVEAGRAIQNGFVTPNRTTLIAATSRVFAIGERSAMGDGRFDSGRILEVARQFAKRPILFDAGRVARAAGVPINAVLLGAIVASGVLRLEREWAEEAIRRSGKSVEANLRGLEIGVRESAGAAPSLASKTVAMPAANGNGARPLLAAMHGAFPAEAEEVVAHGVDRLLDYQGRRYAELYLHRLQPIADRDDAQGALTREVARYLALWMSYEDVIRVADLKTRRERFARVRKEVRAGDKDIVQVVDYLKPGIEELCSILPAALGRRLLDLARRRGVSRWNVGLHVSTTSVSGFLLLRLLAGLRWWRPHSMRFKDEQARIERWLRAVDEAAQRALGLGLAVAQCAQLIKGYGDTHARALRNFELIAQAYFHACTDQSVSPAMLADAIGRARQAALADPDGTALDAEVARFQTSLSQTQATGAAVIAAQ
jgi:indolepyruvate ferredoxin oxidoreductase, beta subunit